MRTPPHRIRRQRWRVRARSQAEAFALRARLREELDRTIQEVLAQVFDELVPGDEVVHLPKLEIHARVASLDQLAEVLPDLVRREIRDRRRPPPGVAAVEPPAATTRTRSDSRVDALIHYLETGTLPWSVETWDRAAITEWLRSITFAEAAAAGAAVRFHGLDRASRARVFRLLLPEDAWAPIARAITPAGGAPAGDELADAVTALAGGGAMLGRFARIELATAAIAGAREGLDAAMAEAIAAVLAEILGRGPTPIELTALLPEGARPLFRRLLAASSAKAALDPRVAPAEHQPRAAAPSPTLPAPQPVPLPPALASGPARSSVEPFGRVVGCAGLAIVHPYLARFFDSVGIERPVTTGGREIAETSLARAAALLYFLATGDDDAPEHELGLIKVLLGLDPKDPLPIAAGLLTDEDRAEAEALLQAVIDHWGALGSTRIDALRGTFLDRRGLLGEAPSGFRLQVETGPYDVLLQKLPWGLGVIKLPWMRRPIFTEWPAL